MYKRQTQDYLVENGGIVITNPNAPTGIYKPLDQIEEIVKAVSYTHLDVYKRQHVSEYTTETKYFFIYGIFKG